MDYHNNIININYPVVFMCKLIVLPDTAAGWYVADTGKIIHR